MQLRLGLLALVGAALGAAQCSADRPRQEAATTYPRAASTHDWPMFGWDVARTSAPPVAMGITAANADSHVRQQITIDGTVDASAIYFHGVAIGGASHDAFFVTTTYGKTLALDAGSGAVLWEYTPSGYAGWSGSYRITNATPVADPDRAHIYAAAPDGAIRRLAVADGSADWTTAITKLPAREKIASPLGFYHGRVIAVTDGYIGDQPPYQGHVAILDAATGQLLHVWNSLCSDTAALLDPASCAQTMSGIWGRAGAVIDTTTGDLYVATGNGLWDGKTNWGDAAISLDSLAARITGNYTPTNTAQLDAQDADIGSTSPVLLGGGLVAQGGKDGQIRLLDWSAMQGSSPHQGGEAQTVSTPSGTDLFTAPAVWRTASATWLFAADNGGTAAWTLSGGKLVQAWKNSNGGTSPVVADGLLFVYDPGGGLRIYDAAMGTQVANLPSGAGHWNSPTVVDGMILLPEGNANRHSTSGTIDIWRLP